MTYRHIEEQITDFEKDFIGGKTLLVIGARRATNFWYNDYFLNKLKYSKVCIIDAFLPNVTELKHHFKDDNRIIVHHLDARNLDKITDNVDVTMWWHGPEHLNESEIPGTITKIENITNKFISLVHPRGYYPQDEMYGNMYEKHLSHLEPDFLKGLGYDIYDQGVPGASVHAWKKITKN